MGAAIHLSTKRQVVYGDYYLPVTVSNPDHTAPSSPRDEPEVTLSLMSGQSIKLTLSRRDATVKAARRQIAQLCCMPEQAVQLLNAGQVLEDELLLIGLESTQIIFDASFLRKGPLPGVSRLGLWHGVQASRSTALGCAETFRSFSLHCRSR